MKLYATRDRIIDFFLQPFVGTQDKQVMAALSATINQGEQHAIQQAPHHFELWCLAEIDEDTGKVTPNLRLVCTCDSLIRVGLREESPAVSRAVQEALGGRHNAPRGAPSRAHTAHPTGPERAHTAPGTDLAADRRAGGGNPPSEL